MSAILGLTRPAKILSEKMILGFLLLCYLPLNRRMVGGSDGSELVFWDILITPTYPRNSGTGGFPLKGKIILKWLESPILTPDGRERLSRVACFFAKPLKGR
jgi:hypothetical protein